MSLIIDTCNNNSGFISAILTIITIFLSLFAIIVSIKAMRLPYKQDLKIYSAIDDTDGKPELHLTLINVGHWPIYLNSVTLNQAIMPLVLGWLEEEISENDRILTPQIVHNYIVPMQNYDLDQYAHEDFEIKLKIDTTTKTYTRKLNWIRG